MEQIIDKTVREIALEYPATTRVFEEFKIDYCCGGRKSLSEACETAAVDERVLLDRLHFVIEGPSTDSEVPEKMAPGELVDYILAKHHIFTAAELERLTGLMAKVVSRHGETHPELFELQYVFSVMADDLKQHMRKEENVLFPYIKNLDLTAQAGLSSPRPHFGTVKNPIRMMESEHDADGARLRRMREITGGYRLPEGACPTFTALYAGLQDLERDLHRHIHLENNVLFPAAVSIEEGESAV